MSSNDDPQEMEQLFGPLYRFSDHKIGDTVKFMLRGREVTGEVTWVQGPGPSPTGRHHSPITYVCAVSDELMPCFVYQNELLG
jgi:hypothetical protein